MFAPGFSILVDQLVPGFISRLRIDDCVPVFYFRLRRLFAQANASIDDFLNRFVIGEVLPQRVRLAFAVPVGSAGHQQVMPVSDGKQPFALFWRIAAMPYFQTIQTFGDERFDLPVGQ